MDTRDTDVDMTDVTCAAKLDLDAVTKKTRMEGTTLKRSRSPVRGSVGDQGKVGSKIKDAMEKGRKFYSVEFFPPHTVEGARGLMNRMDRLANLQVRLLLAVPCHEA